MACGSAVSSSRLSREPPPAAPCARIVGGRDARGCLGFCFGLFGERRLATRRPRSETVRGGLPGDLTLRPSQRNERSGRRQVRRPSGVTSNTNRELLHSHSTFARQRGSLSQLRAVPACHRRPCERSREGGKCYSRVGSQGGPVEGGVVQSPKGRVLPPIPKEIFDAHKPARVRDRGDPCR
jgi:hypothetical protein